MFVPVGIALHFAGSSATAIFVTNFLAILPLAGLLSFATEELSLKVGETIGGLLNATFGNAVELIVGVIALVQDKIAIVQASLLGSMLSNLLLVLGMCFFCGGMRFKEQTFNMTMAQTASGLLATSIASLLIPAAFHATVESSDDQILAISHGTSVILLVIYIMYLVFQLRSHTYLFEAPRDAEQHGGGDGPDATATREEDKQEVQLAPWTAVGVLVVSTALVAVCAEFLVSSIDDLVANSSVSETFVGLILLPIVGNAAEHVTAVTVAIKNKMDLAIGVAVGSSIQIALLVTPLIVILGWILAKPMTLYFNTFETTILFISVFLVVFLLMDGKSNYLEGGILFCIYVIIAVAGECLRAVCPIANALPVWYYPTL